LREAASRKIVVEVALLKAIEARSAISIDSVLKQLHNLQQSGGGEYVTVPASTPAPLPGPKPFRAESTATTASVSLASGSPSAQALTSASPIIAQAALREEPQAGSPANEGDLQTLWVRVLEAVGKASPFTRTYLLEAHPVCLDKGLFTIGFDPEFEDHLGLVDNARNHALLQTKLSELGHANLRIKFIKAEAPARREQPPPETPAAPVAMVTAAPAPAPAGPARTAESPPKPRLASIPFSQDDFKNDPLIQKALEIFKGQIVEVRA
jgi:DNA polymerase-3 subunit gamma/tau